MVSSFETFKLVIDGSSYFDADYYLTANSDVKDAGLDASWHYFHHGWKEGRSPSEAFNIHTYWSENQDIKTAGIEPLFHFLVFGKSEGRRVNKATEHHKELVENPVMALAFFSAISAAPTADPALNSTEVVAETQHSEESSEVSVETPDTKKALAEIEILRSRLQGVKSPSKEQIAAVKDHFCTEFYLEQYPDVLDAGIDPLQHYMRQGWKEFRDPNAYFSTEYYITTSPDVVDAKLNPFFHYVAAGQFEGRLAQNPNGFRYRILKNLKSVDQKIREAKLHHTPPQLSDFNKIDAWLAKISSTRTQAIIGFSHDNFMSNVGGVQIMMRRELAEFSGADFSHISFFPALPLASINPNQVGFVIGALIDGRFAGYFAASDLIARLRKVDFTGAQERQFVIHNLLGHNVDVVVSILDAFKCKSGYFWLHDYASIYNNWNLLVNDVAFRGVPKKDKPNYYLCQYARWGTDQAFEIGKVFRKFATCLVSPSQKALDYWLSSGLHNASSVKVVPHCTLVDTGEIKIKADRTKLKVAFVGHAADHKGWPIFEEITKLSRDNAAIQFYHFGSGSKPGMNFTRVPVEPSASGGTNMVSALRNLEIDIAIIPSICPETFGLVAYEAVAAGAKVLTLEDSGNIASFVRTSGGYGLVFSDEAKLIQHCLSTDIFEVPDQITPLFHLEFSKMTLDVLGAD